ncbi:MAG TPA: hypothetical protein PK926_14430 [Spirochaetota bacterium]|nr:hypothetical protein [Spirochaetota bacterium]HPI91180.1 hypothetical protein [Spirochaetota bacterium]HPR49468.1 hypothetical protein [Spirochaetota bacterium]
MSYPYYGQIGDIWKHLPLCSFLDNEKPHRYIESNSAKAYYTLTKTPQQIYGVYFFFNASRKSDILINSPYYQILNSLTHNKKGLHDYLGSPALALTLLSGHTDEFIFFDIDSDALDNINEYVKTRAIQASVTLLNQDSRDGMYPIIDTLNENDFIHFDPYYIFGNNNSGKNIYDAFLAASARGIKCMLWYGYTTADEHARILNFIKEKSKTLTKARSVEITLKIIQKDKVEVNPGVLGCGVLISNLSDKSFQDIEVLSDELVSIYKGATIFNTYSGELFKKSYSFTA